jgi:uncharacterized protein YhbP (UPF0306 family)
MGFIKVELAALLFSNPKVCSSNLGRSIFYVSVFYVFLNTKVQYFLVSEEQGLHPKTDKEKI